MKATDEELVRFIGAYCEDRGYSPSVRELCERFGYKSTSTIHYKLSRLRERGLISYEPTFPRTVRVVRNEGGS